MGPVSKWVDDHIFFRVRREYIQQYNAQRQIWSQDVDARGQLKRGGRIWYGGHIFDDGTVEQFDEDCRFPCKDLAGQSDRSEEDSAYAYNMCDIDELSTQLGIPWEKSKDIPFSARPTYLGFVWDLRHLTVELSAKKQAKYKQAIEEWIRRQTHNLQEVQSLYGKLLHACLIVPDGRSRLTSLEAMLGFCRDRPFIPRHAPRQLTGDLEWWIRILGQQRISRVIPRPVEVIDVGAYSDASSGFGIAIIVGSGWRAWTLAPGWQTKGGNRDIGWAEAVGFELLVRAVKKLGRSGEHHRVYGNNKGVVEGW
jgi:hypothetical protein